MALSSALSWHGKSMASFIGSKKEMGQTAYHVNNNKKYDSKLCSIPLELQMSASVDTLLCNLLTQHSSAKKKNLLWRPGM